MNGTLTTNDYWAGVISLLREFPCLTRVKWLHGDVSQWDAFLIVPVPGYIESGIGPVPMGEVEWVEIQSTESRHQGRLIPDMLVDCAVSMNDRFTAHSLRFEKTEDTFRIYPPTTAQR